jgi:hypothetical protein
MAEVYGLFSGRDGQVRYVGQTTYDCADRFKQHLRNHPNERVRAWFRSEWKDGYPIECVLLQECDDAIRFAVERHWMKKFPGILNERISGQAWLTAICSKHPVIPEIRAYMRRYLFNVGGFRGVRCDRHWDRFRVLISNGGNADWLPGWDGTIWFPDRTSAIIARDKERQFRLRYNRDVVWSPDIEQTADAA